MESVISYLKSNYVSEEKFLTESECSYEEISRWQENKIFPNASYTTNRTLTVTSVFGVHEFTEPEKWYPRGLYEWVCRIRQMDENPASLKALFFKRFTNKIIELELIGLSGYKYKNESEHNTRLEEEWQHFLNGTYGVCTKDCSPEQIATKDITICVIEKITEKQQRKSISVEDRDKLISAVNLLDAVSSSFSPHERERSSRKRCIELVREKYLDIKI